MAKNRITVQSRFPAVKEAGHAAVREARDRALDAGEHEAEKRLEAVDDKRGYDLPIDVGQQNLGHQSGMIFYTPWCGRFFEYGTVRIQASPFMRPAHRRMRKGFISELGDNFEGWVRRKARVR